MANSTAFYQYWRLSSDVPLKYMWVQIKMCPGDRSLRSQTVSVTSKVVLKIESKIVLVLYLRTDRLWEVHICEGSKNIPGF